MEKTFIPGSQDLNWIVKKEDCVEIWGQNISSHPWKNREYPEKLIKKISHQDFAEKEAAWQKEARAADKKTAEKKAANKIRQEWIANLPEKVNGFNVDKLQSGIIDDVGNFLFSLPPENLELAELGEWIAEEWEAFCEFGE